MRIEDVQARKAYVESIRKSFDDPERNYEWEKQDIQPDTTVESGSFFKVRLLLAVFILAAYILCDKTNTMFYQYSTKEVAEKIAQDYDFMIYLTEIKNML